MQCACGEFTKIITWAREVFLNGYTFNIYLKTQRGNLKWMKKIIINNDAFYPKPVSIALNDQLPINVICFDFASQLLSLLQSKKLMTQDNLLLHIKNSY